ncbi:MAG TPA: hypothetical protein VLX92_29030 [Kofleriaceae bacterium]|nr:hypothetical protein [Kofleriaceae bacterium]
MLAILLSTSAALAADALSMADLQALDKQGSYGELLDKADRVRPSERTADWSKLVRAAALHVLDQIANDPGSDLAAAAKLVELVPAAEHKYGFLTGDKAYLDGKGRALARVVKICAQDGGCGNFIQYLGSGVTRFPRGTARQIALIVSEDELPSRTVHYWALAADDDVDACQDGRLDSAVIYELREPPGDKGMADAQRAAGTCYAALENDLVRELSAADETARPRPAFLINACAVMKSHGAMTVLKKKKCP